MSTKSNKPVKVAIIEDNRFIRDGLKIVLDAEQDIELIGSYPTCEDAFYYDDLGNADVVIMDINLPGISGIKGVKYLKKNLPAIEVIICTAYEDDENVFDAIAAGAVGFIAKKTPPAELLTTLRSIAKGGSPMTPNVARKVIASFQKKSLNHKSDFLKLTQIEQKVLKKISLGKSYTTVAKELNEIEEKVLTHIRNIYEKMQKNITTL